MGFKSKKYSIIPGLVSVETNSTSLNDFLLAQDLDFYGKGSREKFHYKVWTGMNVQPPLKVSLRVGNYTLAGNRIAYFRSFWTSLGFCFHYNFRSREFRFNRLYSYHFVNIGDIFTIGRHLFHAIEVDLAADYKFIVLGAAVVKDKRGIVILAPNSNGKTTFVNRALDRGYSYLSENFLILDTKSGVVHGVSPIFRNKNRKSNKDLVRRISKNNVEHTIPAGKCSMYLVRPKGSSVKKRDLVLNYVSTFSGYYKKNNLIRTLMYYFSMNHDLELEYKELTDYFVKRVKIIDNVDEISL